MRRSAPVTLLLLLSVALRAQPDLSVRRSMKTPFPVTDVKVAPLNQDAFDDILLVGVHGEVRTLAGSADAEGLTTEPAGDLTLEQPHRTLLALSPMKRGAEDLRLFSVSPAGIRTYTPGADAAFGADPARLDPSGRRRARLPLRVGRPTFAPLCRDLNQDGHTDVLVPTGSHVEIWIHQGAEAKGGAPLRRTARIPVRVRRENQSGASRLSDRLDGSFLIPQLKTVDLNGDGRQDLVVEEKRSRAFHLQRADGTISVEPDTTVNLEVFRDTTPPGSVRPGRTLAGSDRQTIQSRDLNGDGIPDFVIAHRRKVWVFHGREGQGPQFTKPAQVLRSADDVTAFALMDLHPDGHADLVIGKVQVPSVGAVIAGALGDLEVEMTVVGYPSSKDGGFETKPGWRTDISITLPSITSIMKNPYAIIQRFEDASSKVRQSLDPDLDGDGKPDVVAVDLTERQLRIWLGSKNPDRTARDDPDALMRDLLFGDNDKEWDLDRLVEMIGQFNQETVQLRTGGRKPDASVPLRPDSEARLIRVETGDLDGDRSMELVLLYRLQDGSTVLDVIGRP